MIPTVLAFINEAIQVTGMNSYFLYKSPFSILITLAQHLFSDFFFFFKSCVQKCLKQPDMTVSRSDILLESSGFPPRLLHLLSFGQMPPPQTGAQVLCFRVQTVHITISLHLAVFWIPPRHSVTQFPQVPWPVQHKSARVTCYFAHAISFCVLLGYGSTDLPTTRLCSMLLLCKG